MAPIDQLLAAWGGTSSRSLFRCTTVVPESVKGPSGTVRSVGEMKKVTVQRRGGGPAGGGISSGRQELEVRSFTPLHRSLEDVLFGEGGGGK
jgi:RNA 3'-terminal phosphate cyclase